VNNLRTAVGAEFQPQATTVGFVEPPVSPAPANHQVAAAPVPAPAPIVAPVAPVPPAQTVEPTPAPQPVEQQALQAEETVAVFLHLSSGERIWAGRFASSEPAEQRAAEIVRALNRPEPGVWAKFGNRLIRPEAVVSIELAQRRED
jgi:hypothetical protein